ncbi:MAG: amino acid adenylation domain-containing protein [bacterium]|nr:amino acid adenylation domain-containing protein [bacterium]
MKKNIIQHRLNDSFLEFKENTAIEYCGKHITYAELDERSDAIADWLCHRGLPKETFIGILMDDFSELIVTILGVLKAGCVFVPLEPSLGKGRLEATIRFVNIGFVITDKMNREKLSSFDGENNPGVEIVSAADLAAIEKDSPGIAKSTVTYGPEDKVYIYFTSGTTGAPNSIIGKNKCLLHFINWEIKEFEVDDTYRFSQFTNPGFDVYLRDIFVPLCSGGTICIPERREIILDNRQLARWIGENRIHLIHCVPTLFATLNRTNLKKNHFQNLKIMSLSGERVKPAEIKKWYDAYGESVQFVNNYGPTETTLAKLFHFIRKEDVAKGIIPVGKTIPGSRVIVLDENMEMCEEMKIGEVYIRTPFRTFGYCNNPELNNQKFIPNPFSSNPDDIIYQSGDLGRFLPDGNLELTGRIDRQVKLRGMRLEPEDIECALMQHPRVNEAVVLLKKGANESAFLFAYITGNDAGDMNNEEDDAIKEYLQDKIPAYMVPSYIKFIDELPRKSNLKIDYTMLQQLLQNESADEVEPRDDIEKKLAQQWSELLGIEKIGVLNTFFALGGNSLHVMSLVSLIHRDFNVKISPKEFFENPTVEKLAKWISKTKETGNLPGGNEEKYASLEAAEKKEYYPASLTQKRFYILQSLNPESTSFNIPSLYRLEGKLEKKRLEETFNRLIKRHSSLRTSFELIDGEPKQKIQKHAVISMEYHEAAEDQERGILQTFIRPFYLNNVPLLRVGLVKTGETSHILLLDMHHIITDGLSYMVLSEEFLFLYEGRELPTLRLQYTDFSEWQNSEKEKERIKKQREYWVKQFEEPLTPLKIPTDHPRPAIQDFNGSSLYFDIAEEETKGLRELALREETSLFMVMFTLYNILLGKLTGGEDIAVGIGVANRGHADLAQIIGLFFNTLPLRNKFPHDKTFRESLSDVKDGTLQAFKNQDYPVDLLVENLIERGLFNRDPSRNPLFDTMFALQNFLDRENTGNDIELHQLKIKPYKRTSKRTRARFDLFLVGTESRDFVRMELEYSTALFKPSTAEKITNFYLEILKQVLEDNDIKIQDVTISGNLLEVKANVDQNEYMDFGF